MTIKITECEGMDAGRGLLQDLAKYECLRRLKRRSKSSQRLPRDHGFVHADTFEGELFISLINVEE